ncbi:MAG: hypothetical protein CMJ75_17085 [Planctomycetaceae bacterium]|nr:hypothetical protein [Planctomycetaceae bacterium]
MVTQILVPFGLHNVDWFPVGFQFVGQHAWQTGANARSRFRSMCQNINPIVGIDGDKQIGSEGFHVELFRVGKSGCVRAPAHQQQ